MKNILHKTIRLFTLASFIAFTSYGQKSNVGIGTISPDNSAILDIQSTQKGLLIPRMTEVQKNDIISPATGLMVYQTGENSGFYFYSGSTWKPLNENDAKSVALDIQNWSKTGDAGTNPSSNFLGTTDAQPLAFRVNNIQSGLISPSSTGSVYYGYGAGLNALVSTSGVNNVGVGRDVLKSTDNGGTSYLGGYNMGVGNYALFNNTTGYQNVALGYFSMVTNTTGRDNLGMGYQTLKVNTTGYENVAVGSGALLANTTGYRNVAIGSIAGQSLGAGGNGNVMIGYAAGGTETGSDKLYIANTATLTPLIYGDFSAKYVTIGDVPATAAKRGDAAAAGYNLLVKGGILTEKVKVALVTTADWADYVFEKEYKENMLSLEDVEKFTLTNKHLPNVPSAQEMVDNGMEVGQTSKMFMEKIEELTLYMIEMNKEIKALKAENASLKNK